MCSEGVSVWFACKLCKSFFLNADDFAYHKKKSHVQEFQNTKFIVFEEQTIPPVSPPENWVSFLSPKEETRIHKIISSPSSTTTTNVDCNPSNENLQTSRNEEFIEIDLQSNKVFTFHDQVGRPGDADEVSDSNDNDEKSVNVQENKLLQNSIVLANSTCDLSHKKQGKHCTTIIASILKHKSSSLKICEEKIRKVVSNPLQAPIKSPRNPYVYLKRLKSSSFPDVKEVTPKIKVELPDLATATSQTTSNSVLFKCRFCSKKIKSDLFQSHVKVCKNPSNQDQQPNLFVNQNLISDPSEVRFHGDLLDLVKIEFQEEAEDSEFPGTFVDTDTDPLEESESQMESSAEEVLNVATSFSSTNLDGNLEELPPQIDLSRYCISCQKYCASIQDLKIHNRNHHGTQEGKRNFQCPHPNCEKTTKTRSHLRMHIQQVHSNARPFVCPHPNCSLSFKTSFNRNRHAKQPHLNTTSGVVEVSNILEATVTSAAVSSSITNPDSKEAPAIDFSRYCVACQQYFVHIQELRSHNQNFHRTQEGHISYKCPYSNCGKTTAAQYDLRIHLMQAHSNARPFHCPYPNCNMSFKISGDRNRHFKCHTKLKQNK